MRLRITGYRSDRAVGGAPTTGLLASLGGGFIGFPLYWNVQGQRLSVGRSASIDDRYRALSRALDVRLEPIRDRTLWRLWIPFQHEEGETLATWSMPRTRDEQIILSCDVATALDAAARLRTFVCEARGIPDLPTPLTVAAPEPPTTSTIGWRCGQCGYPLAAGALRCAECGGVRPEWKLHGFCPTARSASGGTSFRLQRRAILIGLCVGVALSILAHSLVPLRGGWSLAAILTSFGFATLFVTAIVHVRRRAAAMQKNPTDYVWHIADTRLEIGSELDPWYVLPLESIRNVRVDSCGIPTQWLLSIEADRAPTKSHALRPNAYGGGLQIVIPGTKDEAHAIRDSLMEVARRARGAVS